MNEVKKVFVKVIVLMIIILGMKMCFSNQSYALTQQEYKTKIDSILATWENKKFNEGTYSEGHNSYYTCTKCGKGAWECLAFSRYVLNQFYGCCDCCGNLTSLYSENINSVKDLRVGDGLRYNGGAGWNHSIIIIDTDQVGNTVQILECNQIYDTHLVTQRTEPFSEIKNWLNVNLVNKNGESGRAYLIRSPGNNVLSLKNTDTEPPKLNDINVQKHATTTSFTITANITDNVKVTKVQFAVKTEGDPDWVWTNLENQSSNNYTCTVQKSAHGNRDGLYKIEIHAYDANGNHLYNSDLTPIPMGSTMATNLGNFTARIVPKTKTDLALGIDGTTSGSNVSTKTKSLTDLSQLWKFEKQSDDTYKITNVSTGLVLDICGGKNADATNVEIYTSNDTKAQRFCIMNYNGAYRLSGLCSPDWKAIGLPGLKLGSNAELHQVWGLTNDAQTFIFEKVETNLKLNRTELIKISGEREQLSATIEPSYMASSGVTWKSSNTAVATVNSSGTITAVKEGTAKITATTKDGSNVSKTCTVYVKPNVKYTTHVQNEGWQNYVKDGSQAGTSGKGLRLEAIKIKLENKTTSGNIEYRTHIQNIGWESTWKQNDSISGTSGKGLRLEAIQLRLTGDLANKYDIYYRVHAQNFGWLGWAKNGASAGTQGYAYRLEAIQIQLIKKGEIYPTSKIAAFYNANIVPVVNYTTHVQNIGWQSYVKDGAMSGTSGKGLRIEAIKVKLTNMPVTGGIEYRTHIQNIGWESAWKQNDGISGTSGKGLRVEAIQLRLTGNMASQYDVYYRVHAQNLGWLGWAKNGESAGTQGYAYRLEGIQIKLVKKGLAAPGTTANAFVKK